MPVTIREARSEDAPEIARLLGQLGYPTGIDAIEPRLGALHAEGDRVVVAELDGRIAGLAHLHIAPLLEDDRPAAKLSAIVVDAACRGVGVGRALIDTLKRDASKRGCGTFFLTTSERRDDAHRFYERLGLEHTGRRYGARLD